MIRTRLAMAVPTAAILLATAACGGSSSSPSHSASTGPTYTLGVLADNTGINASTGKTSELGVRAGITIAAEEGYQIKYVVADTATSPTTVLTAAQKLVEQDHVTAVLTTSALTFLAANFLASRGVPVLGMAQDGPEWLTEKNMFPVAGRADTARVATTLGQFMKMQGVTDLGVVGYGISPLSAAEAKTNAISAQVAGLKVGYLNPQFPFGSTDVGPAVIAMKNAGVDGFTASVSPNTALRFVVGLRQQGVPFKVALLPTGYGGDLTQAGPGALQSAQGVYFYTAFQPVEMNTPATERFSKALATVGARGGPTFSEYVAYTSVGLFVRGLAATGPNPSPAALIDALSKVRDFDALGLLGDHKVNLSPTASNVFGPDNCIYVTKLVGSTFQLVRGADPICGSVIPGKSISVG